MPFSIKLDLEAYAHREVTLCCISYCSENPDRRFGVATEQR